MTDSTEVSIRERFQTTDKISPMIPGNYVSMIEFANMVKDSGLAPKGMQTVPQIMVAIYHGMEVGFTPLAAIQSIAVINGRPSIWGDGAMALISANPACEDIIETHKGEGDELTYTCTIKRKGRSQPIVGTFSVKQAKHANLWNKEGPWRAYPERMLQMRARSFALRDAFADVLRGLAIAEEQQDVKDITPTETAPVAPSSAPRAEPRQVEGEILPPDPKPKPAPKKKDKPAAEQEKPQEKEEQQQEQQQQEQIDHDGSAEDQLSAFDSYAIELENLLRDAAATDSTKFQALWKNRNKDWTEDSQHDALIAIRDSFKDIVTATKVREKEALDAAAAKDQPADDDFSELGYRPVFLDRLKKANSGDAVHALQEEIEAHVEGGRISQKDYAFFYEDNIADALIKYGS